jgi:hypothetical protein
VTADKSIFTTSGIGPIFDVIISFTEDILRFWTPVRYILEAVRISGRGPDSPRAHPRTHSAPWKPSEKVEGPLKGRLWECGKKRLHHRFVRRGADVVPDAHPGS